MRALDMVFPRQYTYMPYTVRLQKISNDFNMYIGAAAGFQVLSPLALQPLLTQGRPRPKLPQVWAGSPYSSQCEVVESARGCY